MPDGLGENYIVVQLQDGSFTTRRKDITKIEYQINVTAEGDLYTPVNLSNATVNERREWHNERAGDAADDFFVNQELTVATEITVDSATGETMRIDVGILGSDGEVVAVPEGFILQEAWAKFPLIIIPIVLLNLFHNMHLYRSW